MLRGVVIIVLGACGFESGQTSGDPIDALAGPAIDANVPLPDAPPPDAPPPPKLCDRDDLALIACYAFEGTVNDASAHDLHPTAMPEPAFGAGRVGKALQVNTVSVVDVPDKDFLNTTTLTIEAWVNLAELPNGDRRAVVVDADGQYALFVDSDGNAHCVFGGVTELVGGTRVRTDGQWTHLACTYDGAVGILYINGVTSLVMPAPGAIRTNSKTGMSIGSDNGIPAPMRSHLIGAIDELRLMSGARTPAQICAAAGQLICPIPASALH